MSAIKYLLDGREVRVLETLANGKHLVCGIYDNGDETVEDTNHQFIEDKIYEKPPIEKRHAEIDAIESRIKVLRDSEKEARNKVREMEETAKNAQAEFAKYPKLQRLLDFIAGKLTHYVVIDYRGIDIIEFKDSVAQDSENQYERQERKKLKMLTLFGSANGNLDWKLNNYSDGSGTGEECIPCTSYDEAMAILRERLTLLMEKGPRSNAVTIADKYKVAIPADYRQAVIDKERQSLNAQIDRKRAEMAVLEQQISALA